jgi:hypothetical protein
MAHCSVQVWVSCWGDVVLGWAEMVLGSGFPEYVDVIYWENMTV